MALNSKRCRNGDLLSALYRRQHVEPPMMVGRDFRTSGGVISRQADHSDRGGIPLQRGLRQLTGSTVPVRGQRISRVGRAAENRVYHLYPY